MKIFFKTALVLIASVSMVGCFNQNKPNFQFFPDMYVSPSYETYGSYDIFPDQQSAMMPVENTIPRGFQPYELEDNYEGYEASKDIVDFPFDVTEKDLATGRQLYTFYCAVCHGDKGDGKGILVEREKFLGIPSYADAGRAIVPGRIYHVETYGLNTMGSYASQTNEKERWQIAMHVMDLKASLQGTPGVLETYAKQTVDTDQEISVVEEEVNNDEAGE